MTVSFEGTDYGACLFHAQVKQMFFVLCDVDRKIQRIRLLELCGDSPNLLRAVGRLLEYDVDEPLFELEKEAASALRLERRSPSCRPIEALCQ
jgi:hypothetical protein